MKFLPELTRSIAKSLSGAFSLRSHLPRLDEAYGEGGPKPSTGYIAENKAHLDKFQLLQNKPQPTPQAPASPSLSDTEHEVFHPKPVKQPLINSRHIDVFGNHVSNAITNSALTLVSKKPLLAKAALAAVFLLAVAGHSLGFTRLANPGQLSVKEKVSGVLGASTTQPNELLLGKSLGLGGVNLVPAQKGDERVLQATTTSPSGVLRNVVIDINAPTNIRGSLTINGQLVVTGDVTAPNLINQIVAGDNVAILGATTPTPTISVELPEELVFSLQGQTGDLSFTGGTGITISGLTISSSLTLEVVRSIGGCTGCITAGDLATLTVAKGGTGVAGVTKGDILFADSTGSMDNLPIGSAGSILVVSSSGVPAWSSGLPAGIITPDSIDFTKIKDALTLDASTSVAYDATGNYSLTLNNNGSSNLIVNLSSTGDFVIQDNGSTYVTFADDGSTTVSGASTAAGLLTSTLGGTFSGGTIDLNVSSNNATNIGTGSSTGLVSIGGGSGTLAINSSSWDVSSTGGATGLTGLSSSGTITFSGLSTGVVNNTNGTLSSEAALTIAHSGTGISTYTTGDILYASATNVLSKLAVGGQGAALIESGGVVAWSTDVNGTFITPDSLDFAQLKDALTLDANTSVAFGASTYNLTITNNSTADSVINLSSTGDFVIQDNGSAFLTFSDTGEITLNGGSTGYLSSTSGTLSTGLIAVGAGGTGANLTAVAGAVLFSNSSALALTAAGNSGDCLVSAGTGTPTWGACGFTSATQTNNQIIKFASSTQITNSSFNDDGTTVNLAANVNLALASGIGTYSQAYSGTGVGYTLTTSGSGATGIVLNDTNTSVNNPLLVIQSGGTNRYSVNDAGQVTLSPSSTTPIANVATSLTPIAVGNTGSWTAQSNYGIGAQQISGTAYNGYVYGLGGRVSGGLPTASVYYSQVKNDGTLTTWTATSGLPTSLYSGGAVAYNGYLYFTGGYNNSAAVATTYVAKINSNGTLDSFRTTTSMPFSTYNHGAAAYNGYIYAGGGYNGSTHVTSVAYAQIRGDGTLSSWTSLTAPTAGGWGNRIIAYNGYLYTLGGVSSQTTVQYAAIKPDGTIGAWTSATSFSVNRNSFEVVAYNGYLFVLGGDTCFNCNGSTTVYAGAVSANGNISSWSAITSMAQSKRQFIAGLTNGYIVVTGGQNETSDTFSTSYSAPLFSTAFAQNASTAFASGNLFDLWNDEVSKFSVDYSGLMSTNGGVAFTSINNKPTQNLISHADPIGNGGTGAWTTTTSLPQGLRSQAVTTYNGYVYNLGGCNAACSAVISTVYGAKVNPDGTLGSWQTLTNLPAAVNHPGAAAYNGYLFVSGGGTGAAVLSTLYSAPIKTDGTIGAWQTLTSLPSVVFAHSMIVNNGYLFVTGGVNSLTQNTTTTLSTVYSAQITGDGKIGAWQTLTVIPTRRSLHNSHAHNGYLFVVGGYEGASYLSTIYSAPIKTDGTIGAWQTLTTIPALTQGFSSGISNGYLYIAGGSTATGLSTVYSAKVEANGTLGSFATLGSLPVLTSHIYGDFISNGYLFVLGGMPGTGSAVSTVYSTPLQSTALASNTTNQFNSGNLFDLWNNNSSKFAVDYSGLIKTQAGVSFDSINNKPTANLISATDPLGAGGTGAWSTLANLPAGRNYHAALAYNGYLFIVGGGSAVSTVWSAKINPDGNIGAWQTLTNLPAVNMLHSSLIYNGYLFVTGGYNGSIYLSTVYSAPIKSDGTIGSWNTLTNLPVLLRYHSSVAYNGYVFVTGGEANGTVVSTVYSAPIRGDGTIGSFATLTNLPAVRSVHAAFASNGYLFIVGGSPNSSAAVSTVYSAPIRGDGTIGSFATLTNLPVAELPGSMAVLYNDYIYITGGDSGGAGLSTVYSVKANPGGTIGTWATLNNLPALLRLGSSAAHNGYLFVTGGFSGLSTVYSTPLQSTALASNTTNQFNSGNLLDLWNFNTSKFAVDYSGLVKTQAGVSFDSLNNKPTANLISNADPMGAGTTGQTYQTLSNLPERYAFSGHTTYNGYIFQTGGTLNGSRSGNAFSAKVDSTGKIVGGWQTLTALPAQTYQDNAVVAHNGYLYLTGGFDSGVSGQIYSAPIKSDGTIGSWSTASTAPASRAKHSAVTFTSPNGNTYLYMIGGSNASTTIFSTVYSAPILGNGTLGTWATLTDLPALRNMHSSVVHNGHLFVIGGAANTVNPVNTIYSIAIKTDGTIGATWNTLTTLPDSMYGHASFVYNGYLYVAGGLGLSAACGGGVACSTVYSIQVNSNGTLASSWNTLTNLPAVNHELSAVQYGGYMFVYGGYNGSATYYSTAYSVHLQSTALAANTQNQFNSGNLLDLWNFNSSKFAVDYSGLVKTQAGVSFESINNKPTANLISATDPVGNGGTGAWSTLANLPAAMYNTGFASYNGYVFVTGGHTGSAALSTVYSAKVNPDGTIGAWQTLTTLPAVRSIPSTVAYNGYLFVSGGLDGASSTTSTLYSAPIKADGTIGTWQTLGNLPGTLWLHQSVAYNGYLFMIGGFVAGTRESNVYSAQIKGDGTVGSWSTLTNELPQVLDSHAAVAYNGYIFVTGGNNGSVAISKVYSAPMKTDGTIGAFSTLSDLPALTQNHRITIHNGYLFVTGGCPTSCTSVSTAYSVKVNADGTIASTWATLNNLPDIRRTHAIMASNGYLLIVGGYNTSAVSTVYSTPLQSTALAVNTNNTFSAGNLLDIWNNNSSKFAVDYTGGIKTQGSISFERSENSNKPTANLVSAADPLGAGGTGAYSTLANLPDTLVRFGAVTYNNYIFVMGGNGSSANVSTVYSAKINSDGTTSAWISTTGLPVVMESFGSAVHNGYLFVTGGRSSGTVRSTVYSAKINSDGTVGTWQTLTAHSVLTTRHTSFAHNGYLFIAGGCDDQSCSTRYSTTYSAPIRSDGTIGSWTATTVLPQILGNFPASSVYNGYVFITGGQGTTTYVSTVYSSQIKGDGTLGTWQTLTTLPAVRAELNTIIHNGYLFVPGGFNGSAGVSTVYTAKIESNGTIGSFATLGNLPALRYDHQVVSGSGYMFILGGIDTAAASIVYSTPLQSTAFALNTTNTFSAGNLFDIWNNNTSKFSVDYAGNVSTAGSFTSAVTQQLDGTTGSYSTLTVLPAVRTSLNIAAYNGYLYIPGGASGNDATPVSTVYSVKINSDGTISSGYNTLNTLPATTMRHGVVAANGYLYILGGYTGAASVSTTYYAQIKPDGTIGTVTATATLPAINSRAAVTQANGYMYVIGGHNDSASVSTVYKAQIKSDGTLGTFSATTVLPAINSTASAAGYGGYVFVSGGFNDTLRLSTVYSAPVLSDGTLGSWATLNTIPALRQNHQMVAHNGYLYVVGGTADGSTAISTVYSAPVKSDGTIGAWGTLTGIPAIRYQQGVTTYNGYVFVVGGNSGSAAVSTVYSTSLTTSRAFVFNTTTQFDQTPLGGSASLFTLQNNGDARFNVDAGGNGRFSGNIYAAGAVIGTPGAVGDLAENIESSDPSIESGDVVSVCSDRAVIASPEGAAISGNCKAGTIVKSTGAYDSTVLGVISTEASLTFSPETTNGKPVALAGRVPVKVSTENGAIAAGDYLAASSTPGVAMKATEAGAIIGTALEAYAGEEQGKILVFVNTGFVDPIGSLAINLGETTDYRLQATAGETAVDSRLLTESSLVANLEAQITSLTDKFNELSAQVLGVETNEATSSALAHDSSFIIHDSANGLSLDSLTILGTSIFKDIIATTLSVAGLTIKDNALNTLGTLSVNGVEFDQLGNMKVLGNLTIGGFLEAKVLGTDSSAGTVTIPRGETEFVIPSPTPGILADKHQIIVTPIGKAVGVGVQTGSDTFKLILPTPLEEDLEVQYFIIN